MAAGDQVTNFSFSKPQERRNVAGTLDSALSCQISPDERKCKDTAEVRLITASFSMVEMI
jgi:hypothetical protein